MKITVIITTMLVAQVSASFFDVFQGAMLSVQNGFGKLFSDVVTDVKDTVDCTILAVEHVLSLSDDATARYYEKCGNNVNGKNSTATNVSPTVEISIVNNEEYLKKAIPEEIDARINATLSRLLDGYKPHDRLEDVERDLSKETQRLYDVSELVKQEIDKLSNEIHFDFRSLERKDTKPSIDTILDQLKLLEALEQNIRNNSEAIEVHRVIDDVLHKLNTIESSESAENAKVEKILKDLENNSNTTYTDLRQQLNDLKAEESRHLELIKNKIEEHGNNTEHFDFVQNNKFNETDGVQFNARINNIVNNSRIEDKELVLSTHQPEIINKNKNMSNDTNYIKTTPNELIANSSTFSEGSTIPSADTVASFTEEIPRHPKLDQNTTETMLTTLVTKGLPSILSWNQSNDDQGISGNFETVTTPINTSVENTSIAVTTMVTVKTSYSSTEEPKTNSDLFELNTTSAKQNSNENNTLSSTTTKSDVSTSTVPESTSNLLPTEQNTSAMTVDSHQESTSPMQINNTSETTTLQSITLTSSVNEINQNNTLSNTTMKANGSTFTVPEATLNLLPTEEITSATIVHNQQASTSPLQINNALETSTMETIALSTSVSENNQKNILSPTILNSNDGSFTPPERTSRVQNTSPALVESHQTSISPLQITNALETTTLETISSSVNDNTILSTTSMKSSDSPLTVPETTSNLQPTEQITSAVIVDSQQESTSPLQVNNVLDATALETTTLSSSVGENDQVSATMIANTHSLILPTIPPTTTMNPLPHTSNQIQLSNSIFNETLETTTSLATTETTVDIISTPSLPTILNIVSKRTTTNTEINESADLFNSSTTTAKIESTYENQGNDNIDDNSKAETTILSVEETTPTDASLTTNIPVISTRMVAQELTTDQPSIRDDSKEDLNTDTTSTTIENDDENENEDSEYSSATTQPSTHLFTPSPTVPVPSLDAFLDYIDRAMGLTTTPPIQSSTEISTTFRTTPVNTALNVPPTFMPRERVNNNPPPYLKNALNTENRDSPRPMNRLMDNEPLPYARNHKPVSSINRGGPRATRSHPPPPPYLRNKPISPLDFSSHLPANMNYRPLSLTTLGPVLTPKSNNFDDPDYDSFFHFPMKNTEAHEKALRDARQLIADSQRAHRVIDNILTNGNNKARSVFGLPKALKIGK